MKKVTRVYYKCEVCGHVYETSEEASGCESKPVTQDKGVKVGDIVMITGGQGAGSKAEVTDIWIIDKYWGHYSWKRYWHTVAIVADLVGGSGTRTLTFDDYTTL